ncbi:hypothetical protein [Nocardia sp. NPDC050793]|uniref:hypothetical protein n=1 Tax=Nocardia sp. NPDC050793 TaxID=3155159 RepID=UPI0033FF5BA4
MTSNCSPSQRNSAAPVADWWCQVDIRTVRNWLRGNRVRRRWAWFMAVMVVLVMASIGADAIAAAQSGSGTEGGGRIDGISWMDVRDSSGVPVWHYDFLTNTGGITNPWYTALSLLLGLLFNLYMIIVVTAIWLIGFVLEFRWLTIFQQILGGVARGLTGELATPIVLATAGTIGAVFVGHFIVRGFYAKATMQVVTMLAVAALGVIYLADPLAEVLSPQGLMLRGRDVGVSVAAGLNGDARPNPQNVVTSLEGSLADGFIRRPLQVWNFGHVVDDVSPMCRSAWSTAMRSDSATAKNVLASCGDRAASSRADNPDIDQLGTGLLLLIFAVILLLFGLYLAMKVLEAALNAVYHSFMGIFGFAAGGFVYGPTQTFLIRNMVFIAVAAARMVAYIVFLGVYLMVLARLFGQASSQNTIAVMIIAGVVELIAIVQLRKLSESLDRGNDWITERIATALAAGRLEAGAGVPLGLGGGADGGFRFANIDKTLSSANGSILLQNLMRTKTPMQPFASALEGPYSYRIAQAREARRAFARNMGTQQRRLAAARLAAEQHGGIDTAYGVAAAIQAAMDQGVNRSEAGALVRELGGSNNMVSEAIRVGILIDDDRRVLPSTPYRRVAAAAALVADQAMVPGGGRVGEAEYAALRLYAERLAGTDPGYNLNEDPNRTDAQRQLIRDQAAYIRGLAQNPAYNFAARDLFGVDGAANPGPPLPPGRLPNPGSADWVVDPIARRLVMHGAVDDLVGAVQNYGISYRTAPTHNDLYDILRHVREITTYSKIDSSI